jgi:uncharacterized membrane protein YbaN (DUF454 family)
LYHEKWKGVHIIVIYDKVVTILPGRGIDSHGAIGYPASIGEVRMKALYGVLGIIFLALGGLGIVMPFLPTTPFMLLAAFFFARGSKRLNEWFRTTRLYRKHLDSFMKRREMTLKAKLTIIISVTALMGFGFIMMASVPVGRAVLAAAWLAHVLYFGFRVKITPE